VPFLFKGWGTQTSYKRLNISLPTRGQRTRSNRKTIRKIRFDHTIQLIRLHNIAKSNPGPIYGDNIKNGKIKSKMKRKKPKVATTKKNKPVVRSKHSKKSV
jgi:hypothetical protein